jgi:hypothetical protein
MQFLRAFKTRIALPYQSGHWRKLKLVGQTDQLMMMQAQFLNVVGARHAGGGDVTAARRFGHGGRAHHVRAAAAVSGGGARPASLYAGGRRSANAAVGTHDGRPASAWR